MIVERKLKLPLIIFDVGLVLIIGFILAGVVFYPKVDIQRKDTPTLSRVESQLAESPVETFDKKTKGDKDSDGQVVGTEDTKEATIIPQVTKKPSTKKPTITKPNTPSNQVEPTSESQTTDPIIEDEVGENEAPPIGPVKKGDIIAYQGNSGCSTGTHLHWGVYVDGVAVNPRTYINSGRLDWPEKDFTITQEFGANYEWYLRNFGLPGHNAIDMTAGFGAPIYASADGVAYAASDSQPCWITGTVGKGVIIDHGEGLKTIYWQIQ